MSDDHADDSPFGDVDPEDAWDDGDEDEFKLAVLERVISDLHEHRDERFEPRRVDALRLVAKLAHTHGEDPRLDMIREILKGL